MSTRAVLRRISSDVKITVFCGLVLGAMFSTIAVVIFIVRGNAPFEHLQVSLLRSVTTYLIAGATAGLLVGLLLPLTRWLPGAALVAFIAAFVVWFLMGRSISAEEPLVETVKTSAVLGAAFGLPIGVGFWFQARRDKRMGKW